MELVPVDHDPFAAAPASFKLEPVDHDPFAPAQPSGPAEPVYDAMGNQTGFSQPALPANTMPYAEQMGNIGQGADDAVRAVAKGATFGTADKIAAGFGTGFGVLGDYDKRLAGERARTAGVEDAHPIAAPILEAGGNMLGLAAAGAAGLPVFGGAADAALAARAGKAGLSMGLIGAGAGAIKADGDASDRAQAGFWEGGKQAALGAGGPALGSVLGWGARTAAKPFTGYFAPDSWARQQLANALMRSGKLADEVSTSIGQAALESQPQYAAADALGNAGQRALTTVTKAPGVGRTDAVEFLEGRQAGQARRIGNALMEGFEAPQTASATEDALTASRKAASDKAYGAARTDAAPVDTTSVISKIDDQLNPGASALLKPQADVSTTGIEDALTTARQMLTDGRSQVFDFNKLLTHKQTLDDMASAAGRAGRNREASVIGGVADQLDEALAQSSKPYAAARDAHAAASRQIEAVDKGRQAALRGRTEDTVPAFNALSAPEQAAFRPGYVDPYIEDVQRAAHGANKARPFTSEAVKQEFPAFAAPGRADRMMRQLARENEMFGTRAAATGGSQTAENLADAAGANGVDLGAVLQAATRPSGLIGAGIGLAGRAATGSTEAGRQALGRYLLETNPEAFVSTITRTADEAKRKALIAALAGRGVVNAGAAAAQN